MCSGCGLSMQEGPQSCPQRVGLPRMHCFQAGGCSLHLQNVRQLPRGPRDRQPCHGGRAACSVLLGNLVCLASSLWHGGEATRGGQDRVAGLDGSDTGQMQATY